MENQNNEENNEENELYSDDSSKEERKRRKKRKKHKKNNSEDLSDEEQQEKEDKKNQLILKDLIAENFVILHLIGQGAFGQIYISYNMRDNVAVSIKKEIKKPQKVPQLKTESKIYQSLLKINADDISGVKTFTQDEVQGVPKFYGAGELVDSYYLIMDFLGPNLLELFEYCGMHKFTISTVCLIALQMLNRIENLHKHNYIHRDIKPENFLIGMQEKANIIHLIDFGLSKRFKNPKTHQHIPYREDRTLTGTARYVSINTHLGIEQSRRDDLESIGYVLVYFLKGVLPWQGLKNGNRYTRIMEKKLQIPTEILCYGLPEELIFYLNYCKSLRFEDRPDYDYLRGLFIKLLGTCNLVYGLTKEMLKFDWCFEDPANSIWQIYNKKKHGNSNINSSIGKEKSDDNDGEKERKQNGIKKKNIGLKKQLSNIAEVNDLVTNENNPHYERSESSNSESDYSNKKNEKNNKFENEKNLIKEESESKLQSESEETVRESFQPIPQDLKGEKLTEELKTVFFTQAQTEQIDTYITQLMEPQKTEVEIIEEKDFKKTENDIIDNTMNNTINEINNNVSNDKELISSKSNKQNNNINNINKKNSSQESNKKSSNGRQLSKMNIENLQNDDNSRLKMAVINSKNYTQEMEGKVKNLKTKESHLKLGELEDNNNKDDNNIFSSKRMKSMESRIRQKNNNLKNIDHKKSNISSNKKSRGSSNKNNIEKIDENEQNNINNEKIDNIIEEEKKVSDDNNEIAQKEKEKEINEINISEKNNKSSKKEEEKGSEKKDEKNNLVGSQKGKEDDNGYHKSFKTSKIGGKKSKEKDSKKDSKDAKSLGIGYNQETPNGETPDLTPGLQISKEEIIKISKEPVANYYTIIKDLGHGSYGQVKKVKHKKLNEIRAMKITNKKTYSSKYEIEILRKISHPNITNIFEIFEDSKKYYVIMEFLEGGELFDAITSIGSFSEESACQVMKQILSAIFYLHSSCIVHRDLKPENIMLLQKPQNGNYHIKLIDFGTAKTFKPGKKMNKFIGTSYYIAPEVLKERYDEKCDVWSCGIILYILLCGYPPFNGNTNVEIFHAIQNQNPIFTGEEWEDITPEAKDLIKLMLKKNPNERWNAEQCLKHKWFKMLDETDKRHTQGKYKLIQMNAINHMAQFVSENRFKQAVLQFISTQFNLQKEEGDLRDIFKSIDISGTGQITKNEFINKLIELYGENDGRNIATTIFNNLDMDGSGKISYNEFLSAMISSKKVVTEERLEKAFNIFDKDGSGKLSVDEIKNIFGGTEEQWKKVISEIDLNKDGEVDFAEFKIMMENMDKNKIIEQKEKTENSLNTQKSKDISED